jgi:hypothetical protein
MWDVRQVLLQAGNTLSGTLSAISRYQAFKMHMTDLHSCTHFDGCHSKMATLFLLFILFLADVGLHAWVDLV